MMHPAIRQALESRRFFKLICGASYRNAEFIAALAQIFTMAGAHVIDVGADPELVTAAQRGISAAQHSNHELPLVMVSVGVNQDIHFLKVAKDFDTCDHNGFCVNACPHEVFVGNQMRLENCLGCDYCVVACPSTALTLVPREPLGKVADILSHCLNAGANALEIHTGTGGRKEIEQLWEIVQPFVSQFQLLAFSMGAHGLSFAEVLSLAKDIVRMAGSDIIIQADGKPISGRKGKRSTLPCLALAKYLIKQQVTAYIQVSGGTNNLTGMLAREEGIPIHGVAMGSFARKYLSLKPSDPLSEHTIQIYIERARELIRSVSIQSLTRKP